MTDNFQNKPYQSAWENNGVSSSPFDPPPPARISFAASKSPANYAVLPAKYNTPVNPYYNSNYRPVPSNPAQATLQNNPPATKSAATSCKDQISVAQVIGILAGLVLAGIPLAVMVTLFVQLPDTSSNTTTTASGGGSGATTATISVSLPSQCSSSIYMTWNDATRLNTYQSCCSSDCISTGWYRVTGASGTRLATAPVSTGFCFASYPIWYNGSLPTTLGGTTSGMGCANAAGTFCSPSYSPPLILATNCSSFYVFYLVSPPSCGSVRYCTSY